MKTFFTFLFFVAVQVAFAQLYTPSAGVLGTANSAIKDVGIGTSNPLSTLHINKASGQATLKLSSANTGGGFIGIERFGNGSNFYAIETGAGNNDDMRVHINGNWSAPLMIFQTNGNVGIGTASPAYKLDVSGAIIANSFLISQSSGNAQIYFKNGSALDWDLGTQVGTTTQDFNLYNRGSATVAFSVNKANNNVGIGTTVPDAKLTVKGTIHTSEVKVDLSGAVAPDYVFENNYNLPTLEEINSYIKVNKHLPEVPSACSMEENGVNLGEMNMLLLKKVEELTLYMIEMKKESDIQLHRIDRQQKEIESLKKKI